MPTLDALLQKAETALQIWAEKDAELAANLSRVDESEWSLLRAEADAAMYDAIGARCAWVAAMKLQRGNVI